MSLAARQCKLIYVEVCYSSSRTYWCQRLQDIRAASHLQLRSSVVVHSLLPRICLRPDRWKARNFLDLHIRLIFFHARIRLSTFFSLHYPQWSLSSPLLCPMKSTPMPFFRPSGTGAMSMVRSAPNSGAIVHPEAVCLSGTIPMLWSFFCVPVRHRLLSHKLHLPQISALISISFFYDEDSKHSALLDIKRILPLLAHRFPSLLHSFFYALFSNIHAGTNFATKDLNQHIPVYCGEGHTVCP